MEALFCAAAAAVLVLSAPVAPAEARPVGSLDPAGSAGCVPIARLGLPNLLWTAPITGATRLGRVDFPLPATATQGPATWYLIQLHARVTLADEATGTAIVSAATNGRTAAQIEFTPTAAGMEWSTVSAAEPARREQAARRTAEIRFANYLQRTGVRGGGNTLTFDAEVAPGGRITSVEIFGDTCLETTTVSPEGLDARAGVLTSPIRAGGGFAIRVEVHNTGTRVLQRVIVSVVPGDDGIRPVDGGSASTMNLTGVWTVDLPFRALTPGEHTVTVDVGTGISPHAGGTSFALQVVDAPRRAIGPGYAVLVGSMLVALIVAAFIRSVPRPARLRR